MEPEIILRPIDQSNEETCRSLNVSTEQEELVANNSVSLEQARANQHCRPIGICHSDEMVGFLMYEPRGDGVFSVHRLMIDRRYQRQGFGRKAMELIIDDIKRQGGETIYLSFRPENTVARVLFDGLGFVEQEVEPDGEVLYRLGPRKAV